MTYPKTIWNYSEKTEALRILQAAYNLKNGFYTRHKFLVLPSSKSLSPNQVVFPDFNYKSINYFWKKVSYKKNVAEKYPTCIYQEILENFNLINKIKFTQLKNQWKKSEKQFFDFLRLVTNYPDDFISSLEIRPTMYGTIATAYSDWTNDKSKITVYIKFDADASHIAEAILIDYFVKIGHYNKDWNEVEAIIDYMLTNSTLKKVFPKYKPTLSSIRYNQRGTLAQQSKLYLKKLGFSQDLKLRVDGNTIYYNNKNLNKYFSASDRKILEALLKERGKVLIFDKLADIIWGENSYNSYSEYAITKRIERIRRKLMNVGVNDVLIHTVKKEGYLIV